MPDSDDYRRARRHRLAHLADSVLVLLFMIWAPLGDGWWHSGGLILACIGVTVNAVRLDTLDRARPVTDSEKVAFLAMLDLVWIFVGLPIRGLRWLTKRTDG